jgi:hypothetical protein
MRPMRRGLLICLFLCLAVRVAAQSIGAQVGTLADLEGQAEVGRGGEWSPATIGAAVEQGDQLRTGSPGRMRVVFLDESVLIIGDNTELIVDQLVFDPEPGVFRSLMRILRGKVRAIVNDRYQQPGSSYEIESPNAIVGVRGTEFVLRFDPVADVSEVVGVGGRARVHSVLDRAGHVVFVTERELTTVARGQFPTAPRRLDDDAFRLYLEGLEFVGAGLPESQTVDHPLLTGTALPPEDRVGTLPLPPAAPANPDAPLTRAEAISERERQRDPSDLVNQSLPIVRSQAGQVGVDF